MLFRATIVALLLTWTPAVTAQQDTIAVKWQDAKRELQEDQVVLDLSPTYREWATAYRARIDTYEAEVRALRNKISHALPEAPSAPDEIPVISVFMERTTKTADGHGFFGTKWDQRETATVDLLEVYPDVYVVLGVNGSTSVKAPLGDWREEKTGIPDFYPRNLYPGRALIHGDVRGDLR